MGISTSLVLIAAGAILKWAVTATVSGVDLQAVGVVLLVVGAVGLVLSLDLLVELGRVPRSQHDHDGRARRAADLPLTDTASRCEARRPLPVDRSACPRAGRVRGRDACVPDPEGVQGVRRATRYVAALSSSP